VVVAQVTALLIFAPVTHPIRDVFVIRTAVETTEQAEEVVSTWDGTLDVNLLAPSSTLRSPGLLSAGLILMEMEPVATRDSASLDPASFLVMTS